MLRSTGQAWGGGVRAEPWRTGEPWLGSGRFQQRENRNKSAQADTPSWECLEVWRDRSASRGRQFVGRVPGRQGDAWEPCGRGTLCRVSRRAPHLRISLWPLASAQSLLLSRLRPAPHCWCSLPGVLWPLRLLEGCTLYPVVCPAAVGRPGGPRGRQQQGGGGVG